MKNATLILIFFLSCFFCFCRPLTVHAQDSTLYRVVTNDGNTFIGTIVSEDEAQVVLQTENLGQITIQRSNIKSMREVEAEQIKAGEYWFPNPHGTRYLFSTNAMGLKAGEGYYQNTWIFFNNVNVGITDNVSLGGGLIPMFLFGVSETPIWILPKVSIPLLKDNLHLAAGGMFGGILGGGESYGIGLAYGVVTVGDLDKNLSFGTGFGYGDGEWSDIPLFNVSGMVRLNRTMYLISENYFFSFGGETTGFISGAARWSPENFALDFGLLRPVDSGGGGGFIGIPWLGVTLPFGR